MYRLLRLLQKGKRRLGGTVDAPPRTVGAPGEGLGGCTRRGRETPCHQAGLRHLPRVAVPALSSRQRGHLPPPPPPGRPPPASLRTRGLSTLPSAGYFSAAQEVRGWTRVRNGAYRQAGTLWVTAEGEGQRDSPSAPQPPGLRTHRGVPVCKRSLAEARVSTPGTGACGGCPRALTGQARAGIAL